LGTISLSILSASQCKVLGFLQFQIRANLQAIIPEKPLEQIINKLKNMCSKDALLEYSAKYAQSNFKFFSYGSNMNKEKFEADMENEGVNLSLVCPKRLFFVDTKEFLATNPRDMVLLIQSVCQSKVKSKGFVTTYQ
jgi:hypothetical protein